METKSKLIRIIILKDELNYFHNSLLESNDFIKSFRLFKQNIIQLNIFRESLKEFNKDIREHDEILSKLKKIRKKLDFINHLRNKISGHLDNELTKRAAQWEPIQFHENIQDNLELQTLLAYKSILETAINSYLDRKTQEQKVFKTEIDLNIESNRKMFYDLIFNLNIECINILEKLYDITKDKIKFTNDSETREYSRIAGSTDFDLKNQQTLEINSNENPLISDELLKQAFDKTNPEKSIEKLNEIIQIIKEQINNCS